MKNREVPPVFAGFSWLARPADEAHKSVIDMGRCYMDRSERLNMLLSQEEKTLLRRLASAAGLTVTDYIRQLIRRQIVITATS